MIIEDIKRTGSERILNFNQLSAGKGKGTQEDPFLVESSDILPKQLRIINSDFYVNFSKCNFELFILKKCQNIKISNSNCQAMHLENCIKFKIENCQINEISIRKCNMNNIKNCQMSRFVIIKSYENIIENSTLNKVRNISSSGNIFKNIQIPKKYINYLLKNKFMIQMLLISLFILITTFIGTIRSWIIDLSTAIWAISMFSLALSIFFTAIYWDYRKLKQFESNKII